VSLHIDSSALLKPYFEEPDSRRAEDLLASDPDWITGRHTSVELRRNLARELEGSDLAAARRQFERDWANTAVVELTREVCEAAAELSEATGAPSLDALHLVPRRLLEAAPFRS
jgi:predicted nucleic acid-binding protein